MRFLTLYTVLSTLVLFALAAPTGDRYAKEFPEA